MSLSAGLRSVDKCLMRAAAIEQTGSRLAQLEDEWFAVCYFYSAYHLVKAAFIQDEVFDSATALSRIDPRLAMDDRYITRHNGRIAGRERTLGVNDIVKKLYPQIAVRYVRLHTASIAVRYSEGLGVIASDSVLDDFEDIRDSYYRGELKA